MIIDKSNRIEWPDTIKGIAITIVVFGHAIIPELAMKNTTLYCIYLFINAINMPIFFFISGYLNKKKGNITKAKLKNRITSLLKWYVGYSIFVYLIYVFFKSVYNVGFISSILADKPITFKSLLIGMVDNRLNLSNHLWFLYVLIILNIIRYLVLKINLGRKMDLAIAIISGILSTILFHYHLIDELVWKIMTYYLFFVFGEYYLYFKNYFEYKYILYKYNKILFCIITIFYLTVCRELDGDKMRIIYVSVRTIIGALSIPIYFEIYTFIKNNIPKLNNIYREIGINSIYIYIIHQPFIVPGTVKIIGLFLKNSALQIILAFIIGMVISLAFAMLMNVAKKIYTVVKNLIFYL